MRYLIFNITVLTALGYLFMASPEQSVASWLGKAPQMFDAARDAGREPGTLADPSETAGGALIDAIEPVVNEMLAPPPQTPPPDEAEVQLASADGETGPAETPVTMADIETIIRTLLETQNAAAGDQATAASPVNPVQQLPVQQAPVQQAVSNQPVPDQPVPNQPLPNQPVANQAAVATTTDVAASPAEVPVPAEVEVAQAATVIPEGTGPAVSDEMSDAEIAAAFERLQKVTTPDAGLPQQAVSQAAPSGALAAAGNPVPNADTAAGPVALTSAPPEPVFMSPGERADSLALMVEELQMMYLERTGG